MSTQRTLHLDNQHNIIDTENTRSEQANVQEKASSSTIWSGPKVLLRLEGMMLLTLAIYFYAQYGTGWLFFGLLILAPDLSMLGYLAGPHMGAIIYNLFHTYMLPTILILCGIVMGSGLMVALALIWFAHIGMDRLCGYGLKYTSAFKHTHLNRV